MSWLAATACRAPLGALLVMLLLGGLLVLLLLILLPLLVKELRLLSDRFPGFLAQLDTIWRLARPVRVDVHLMPPG